MMAQASLLLEEEDEVHENILLLNFYQGNLLPLKQVSLHQIPDELKLDAAAVFYATSLYDNEWIGILENLGIDQKMIYVIECKTRHTGDLPLYVALRGILQDKTNFGDFVDVLCKKGKFRILRDLKPFVEGLLSEQHSLNKEKMYSGPLPSAPDYLLVESTSSVTDSGSCRVKCAHYDSEYSSVNYQEESQIKQINTDQTTVLDQFQNSNISPPFVKSKQFSNNSKEVNRTLTSVFIMHSMLDKKYAKRLAARFKENKFLVVTSADIYPYLRQNHTRIMKMVDEKVDFVIPVVSKSFMNQIKMTGYNTTEDKDIESVANTFMYDRLLDEYSSQNNCFNFRVKPVIYSLESRRLTRDQILSLSTFLSFNDLEDSEVLKMKLFQHLKGSKDHVKHLK